MSQQLIDAYLKTEYRVSTASGRQVLRIDVPSAFLGDVLRHHGADEAAFITACNPYSRSLDVAENTMRMAQLRADITDRWVHYDGEGVDVSGTWPAEPSVLVAGISLFDAAALAGKYQQNAFLYCNRNSDEVATPRLALIKDDGYYVRNVPQYRTHGARTLALPDADRDGNETTQDPVPSHVEDK